MRTAAASTANTMPVHQSSVVPGALNGGLAIGLVYLNRWPDLPAQLSEHEVLVNRICTLLSNKPRASHLIHLLLRAPRDDVHAALRGLLQSGCVQIGSTSTVPGTGDTPAAMTASRSSSRARKGTPRSTRGAPVVQDQLAGVLGKLWSRISS